MRLSRIKRIKVKADESKPLSHAASVRFVKPFDRKTPYHPCVQFFRVAASDGHGGYFTQQIRPIDIIRDILDRLGRRAPLTRAETMPIVERLCERYGVPFYKIERHINLWTHVRWRATRADGPFCPLLSPEELSYHFCFGCGSLLDPVFFVLPAGYYEELDLGLPFSLEKYTTQISKRKPSKCAKCRTIHKLIRHPKRLLQKEITENVDLGKRFYVYALVDARDGKPFYIGKGTQDRAFFHLKEYFSTDVEQLRSEKLRRIHEIVSNKARVVVTLLRYFDSEREAYVHEEFLIRTTAGLTNVAHRALAE